MRSNLHSRKRKSIKQTSWAMAMVIALAFGSTATANAAGIGFDLDLTGGFDNGVHPSLSYSFGGITVDITPFSSLDPDGTAFPTWSAVTGPGRGLAHTEKGIGVKTSHGNKNLNGQTPMEGIRFRFSDTTSGIPIAVILNAIDFRNIAAGQDDFNLTLSPLSSPGNIYMDEAILANGWFTLAAASAIGSDFMLWADDSNDIFRVAGLDVTAVPIPAAVWLFGTGIVGLLGFARRRKATSAPA